MSGKEQCPKLAELAEACMTGACNSYALIRHLGESVNELQFGEVRGHPAIKVVLGQISYLCGESLGPSSEAIQAWEEWNKAQIMADEHGITQIVPVLAPIDLVMV